MRCRVPAELVDWFLAGILLALALLGWCYTALVCTTTPLDHLNHTVKQRSSLNHRSP